MLVDSPDAAQTIVDPRDALSLFRQLLTEDGSIYLHVEPDIFSYVSAVMDSCSARRTVDETHNLKGLGSYPIRSEDAR